MNPWIRGLAVACLLGATACTPVVSPASRGTLRKLRQNSVPRSPTEFRDGQFRAFYRLQLQPGALLRLPMRPDHAIPTLPGSINEHPLPWIVDTGANFPLLLDARSAADSGLRIIRDTGITGSGIGGKTSLLLARFDSLALGHAPYLGHGIAGVLPQSYEFAFAGVPIHRMPLNLIGLPLLERFSFLTLDGPGKEVRMGYQTPFVPRRGAQSFPFRISDGRLWIDLHIGNQRLVAFLDTGCGSSLRLPEKVLRRLPPSAFTAQKRKKRRAMGVGGVEMEEFGQLREVRIQSIRWAPLEFDTSPDCTEALLGWEPFRPFCTTIDFRRRRIWVESSR